MQIPPSQWNSAAASAMPQLSPRPGNPSATPATLKGVQQVVEGDQTQDRDADERYDGNSGEQSNKQSPSSEEHSETQLRKLELQLAAEDPEPPPSFESWG